MELKQIKEQVITAVSQQMGDIQNVDTKELYQAVDIIKDLAEAEYYCQVVKAMEEGESFEDRYGYPMGKGRKPETRYKPYVDQMPYIDKYLDDRYRDYDDRYGYPMNGNGKNGNYNSSMNRNDMSGNNSNNTNGEYRHGEAYGNYVNSRRAYTETNSPKDRDEMNRNAREHINSAIGTMTEIWQTADVDLKRQMKTDLQALLNKMQV